MEENSMAENSIIESPMIGSPMIESPIIESSMIESVTEESPTEGSLMEESLMEENQMGEENEIGESLVLRDTLRKRKSRKNESPQRREIRLARERERKWQKRAENMLRKFEADLIELEASLTDNSNQDSRSEFDVRVDELDVQDDYLQCEFDISQNYTPPSAVLDAYDEKTLPKKFSYDNNMDPGEVSEELQGLTEIEEMLIAQVFPIMVIYRLREGQHGYRGIIINFSQDVEEFTNATAFRDFRVRRDKVTCALRWLKKNNDYYSDITIDNENLQFLPEDDFIDDQLRINQLTDDEFNKETSSFMQKVSNHNESNNDIEGNEISNTE
ncbi:10031_t:CDS:2, partial [Racocetra fulgida]